MYHYDWILFDLDGTLFDYEQAEASALQRMFFQQKLPWTDTHLSLYQSINSTLWQKLEKGDITPQQLKTERFSILMRTLNLNADGQICSDCYLSCLADETVLTDGAYETLEMLHPLVNMAAVTNGLSQVQHSRLEKAALGPFFQHRIISEEIGVSKPHKAFFDHVFQIMKHPAKNKVLIVGDSLTSDMAGGAQYGIATCWYNPGKAINSTAIQTRWEIHDIREVLNLIHHG